MYCIKVSWAFYGCWDWDFLNCDIIFNQKFIFPGLLLGRCFCCELWTVNPLYADEHGVKWKETAKPPRMIVVSSLRVNRHRSFKSSFLFYKIPLWDCTYRKVHFVCDMRYIYRSLPCIEQKSHLWTLVITIEHKSASCKYVLRRFDLPAWHECVSFAFALRRADLEVGLHRSTSSI